MHGKYGNVPKRIIRFISLCQKWIQRWFSSLLFLYFPSLSTASMCYFYNRKNYIDDIDMDTETEIDIAWYSVYVNVKEPSTPQLQTPSRMRTFSVLPFYHSHSTKSYGFCKPPPFPPRIFSHSLGSTGSLTCLLRTSWTRRLGSGFPHR